MIILDKKTKQDFLSPTAMEKLHELGVDISDSKYCIIQANIDPLNMFIVYKSNFGWESQVSNPKNFSFVCDTYTLSELLLKLFEWNGLDGYKGLSFFKDAPFYCFFYKNEDGQKQDESCVYSEYPLLSAYNLLVWCIEHNYAYVYDISDKGDYEYDINIDNLIEDE